MKIRIVFFLALASGLTCAEDLKPPKPLLPAPEHVEEELQRRALLKPGRAQTGAMLIDGFIDSVVDGNRLILQASDYEAFKKLPAYAGTCTTDTKWVDSILERSLPRIKESIAVLQEIAKEKLDFASKDTIPVTRRWDSFPTSKDEVAKRWRAIVIDDVIRMAKPGADDAALQAAVAKTTAGFVKNLEGRAGNLGKLSSDDKAAAALRARLRCGDSYGTVFSAEATREQLAPVGFGCGLELTFEPPMKFPIINGIRPGSQSHQNGAIRAQEPVAKIDGRYKTEKGSVNFTLDFTDAKTRGENLARLAAMERAGVLERCDVGVVRNGSVETVRVEPKLTLRSEDTVRFRDVEIAGKRVRVISIPSFHQSEGQPWNVGTVDQVKAILKSAGKYDAVALDLKYNPGGSVDEANRLAALFLDDDTTTMGNNLTQRDKKGDLATRPDVIGEKGTYPQVPLFVLTNSKSASASEMTTAILQSKKRALIIGDRTFGKATQMDVYLQADRLGFQFTTGVRTTPDGKPYQGEGLAPDVSIPDHAGLLPDREAFRPEIVKSTARGGLSFEAPEHATVDEARMAAAKKAVDDFFAGIKVGDLSYAEAGEKLAKIFSSKEIPLNFKARQERFETINKYYAPDEDGRVYLAGGFNPASIHGQAALLAMAAYLKEPAKHAKK